MKQFLTSVKALLCVWLVICAFMQTAVAGTVTGQVQTPSGGGFANATFSFTLTQPALVSGTATIAPATVNCYTDANGNVVGEPNPLVIPTVSANLASGTLAATTYFVKITYIDGTGQTVASPEATLILSSTGTLVVTAPTRQPTNATGYNVYISTATGTETLQGTVTGTPGSWGNFSQASALGAGSALPGSNTTSCKLRFNDELQPSFVCYDVGLISSSGSTLPGYPQYWYLSGGTGGTVNIGVGTPQSTVCQGSGVSYPQSIVAQPIGNATQSIGGGLDLGAFPFNAGPVTATSASISGATKTARLFKACYVDGATYTTIAGAYNDATNCGMVIAPPLYNENLLANLVLNRSSVPIVCEAACTINTGTFQITAAGTINNVSLVGPYCGNFSVAAGLCFNITHSGATPAIVLGDSSTQSGGLFIHGVNISTTGAGACLQLNNAIEGTISDSSCNNASGTSPIGVITLGTGQFAGILQFNNFNITMRGTNSTGYQFQNLTVHVQIHGGSLDLDGGASAVCFDVQGSGTGSVELENPNANTCNTAVKVESSATQVGAIVGTLRIDSGVSSVANFATGTSANQIKCINCGVSTTYTDATNGSNGVEFPVRNMLNGKNWSVIETAGASGFLISDVSDGSVAFGKNVSGAIQSSASNGNPVRFNLFTGSGVEWWDGAGNTKLVEDSNGTLHPAAVNAVGLGTAALPFKNFFIGAAATNNTSWTVATTAARTFTSPDGNSSSVMPFSFTTTAATTDNVAVTGMTSSGHCTLTPTNTAAAAGIASVFISAKAANQITVTHTATANWNFDGLCTSN